MNPSGFSGRGRKALLAIGVATSVFLSAPRAASGQPAGEAIDSTVVTTVEADDGDLAPPKRQWIKWNEYDGPISTFRFGAGLLVDYAAYAQDEESKQQLALEPDVGVRDFRLLFKGKFKTKRPFSWTLGYMYDGADDEWRFRQTGFDIGFPELKGHLFVGRTKEGYSMVKVMVGYHGVSIERSPALDAFVPILADGLKWMGYFPDPRIHYSLGWFTDTLSENEKFATYDHQVVARVVWQPILSDAEKKVLHLGVMAREGEADDGAIRIRSRPGAYLAPYFLDTGQFAASDGRTGGFEAFYRSGSWLFGTEYNWQEVDAANGDQPLFRGGNTVISWLITGETRAYNAPGGTFLGVSPERTVFEGGPGAWEAVLDVSYSDFDSGSFQGGKFWRVTPMVNWHLSDNMRFEMVYGLGVLDRFDLQGTTQFFQLRLQLTL